MTSRTTHSMTRDAKGESLEESLREKSCRQAGDGRFSLRPILQLWQRFKLEDAPQTGLRKCDVEGLTNPWPS